MYGIKNCDTIKKARRYLEDNGINYQFHDYRVEGIDDALLSAFIAQLGWEVLVNKEAQLGVNSVMLKKMPLLMLKAPKKCYWLNLR